MSRSPPWNAPELTAIIGLYESMLSAVQLGIEYNKAQMIREARGEPKEAGGARNVFAPLRNRSKGSIEAKLMNVTAAVVALERPDLSMSDHGYRPLPNMQAALKDAVTGWATRIPVGLHGESPWAQRDAS